MIKIKQLPPCERPVEKLYQRGIESLTDAELIAVILRNGTQGSNIIDISKKIIDLCNQKGGIGYIGRISDFELKSVKGIGKIKSAQIKCIGELCRRMWEQSRGEIKRFSSANDVAEYYNQYLKGINVEETRILLLDNRNNIINDKKMTIGTNNAALISVKDVFYEALISHAIAFIIIHNHPSGDPSPSIEDKIITSQLINASKIMELHMVDHIIIGDNSYYSFKENGLLE